MRTLNAAFIALVLSMPFAAFAQTETEVKSAEVLNDVDTMDAANSLNLEDGSADEWRGGGRGFGRGLRGGCCGGFGGGFGGGWGGGCGGCGGFGIAIPWWGFGFGWPYMYSYPWFF